MDEQPFLPVPPPVGAPPPLPPYPAAAGLSDSTAAGLAYITIIPAVILLLVKPYSQKAFVRFNAMQSLCLTAAWMLLHILVIIPLLGWIVMFVGYFALFVAWVLCLVNALQGKMFRIPLLGDLAEGFARQV